MAGPAAPTAPTSAGENLTMIASTTDRVSVNTADRVNQQIRCQTEDNVARCTAAGPEAIERRLAELDQEWDVERLIEAEAPFMILAGLLLGNTVSRTWLLVPIFASGMLLLHNLQGWYPLLPLFRRMGVRTAAEIDRERYALKALRGDFPQSRRGAAEASSGGRSSEPALPSRA